jgi:hypothetical protein
MYKGFLGFNLVTTRIHFCPDSPFLPRLPCTHKSAPGIMFRILLERAIHFPRVRMVPPTWFLLAVCVCGQLTTFAVSFGIFFLPVYLCRPDKIHISRSLMAVRHHPNVCLLIK